MVTLKYVLDSRNNIWKNEVLGNLIRSVWTSCYSMKQYNLGIEATLEIIGGKWKALIICLLMSGVNCSAIFRASHKRSWSSRCRQKLNIASRNMGLQPIRSLTLCVLAEKKILESDKNKEKRSSCLRSCNRCSRRIGLYFNWIKLILQNCYQTIKKK